MSSGGGSTAASFGSMAVNPTALGAAGLGLGVLGGMLGGKSKGKSLVAGGGPGAYTLNGEPIGDPYTVRTDSGEYDIASLMDFRQGPVSSRLATIADIKSSDPEAYAKIARRLTESDKSIATALNTNPLGAEPSSALFGRDMKPGEQPKGGTRKWSADRLDRDAMGVVSQYAKDQKTPVALGATRSADDILKRVGLKTALGG